jgi:predicted TIM-barrel fold metal-dependent hydrolase
MTYAPGRAFLRNPMCCITPNAPRATPPVDRRRFLAGSAAVLGSIAAPVVLGVSRALSQANPNRIDVHHHYLVQGTPPSALEWGTDTTRSIINLIFSGTSQKYKDINWIWSHGGGALSSVAERLLVQMVSTPPYKSKFTREQVQAELNRFYYDTAQVSLVGTLAALAKFVPVSQIVYGTDFPFRTAADHTKGVTSMFRGDDLKAVDRENALRIIPRLKTV